MSSCSMWVYTMRSLSRKHSTFYLYVYLCSSYTGFVTEFYFYDGGSDYNCSVCMFIKIPHAVSLMSGTEAI